MNPWDKIGGSGWGEEECPACKKKFNYWRAGSHDWEAVLCDECRSEQFRADLYRAENEEETE